MSAPIAGERLLFAACVALSRGAILLAPGHSVGPVRAACEEPDALRFAVVSVEEGERAGWHIVDAMTEFRWGIGFDPEAHDDWSAFGAARLFIDLVGEQAAREALDRLV